MPCGGVFYLLHDSRSLLLRSMRLKRWKRSQPGSCSILWNEGFTSDLDRLELSAIN